jgi:hypothetical protein
MHIVLNNYFYCAGYIKYNNSFESWYYVATLALYRSHSLFPFCMQKPLRYLLLVGTLTAAGGACAQTGSVGIGIAVPNSSAALDVSSTTKGLLPPRMTQAQRNAIANPAIGLLIVQSDNTPGLYQYTATGWATLGTFNTESQATIAAPTTATQIDPAATTIVYTNNSGGNGPITLRNGTEGQRLVIINNDNEYLPVVSGSGTGNILPRYGARFIYTAGAWRRES